MGGFMHFPGVLALSEMQTALSRVWTCVADSISHDKKYTAYKNLFNSLLDEFIPDFTSSKVTNVDFKYI